jgi:mannose-6-phosphate isomerase
MSMRHSIPRREALLRLPPNRVWRTYLGGGTLDRLAGAPQPTDGSFPEDWIGSTTRAVNPGREHLVEGISEVLVDGERHSLAEVIAGDQEYYLGAAHVAAFGPTPLLLVKFLDSATRLHLQVHPTTDFAQRFLDSRSGKTEAYHVLAVRPQPEARSKTIALPPAGEATGYIYLGFQRPPTMEALRSMIDRQDIAALEACFDRIPVQPGDTYVVPGGVPHALGAGVFLVEIQEPSDLVVRFEFSRAGATVPPSGRYMGRDLDFCLNVFDLTAWPANRIAVEAKCPPKRRRALGPDSWQDELVDATRTRCFRVRRTRLGGDVAKEESGFHIGIVTSGSVTITAGDQSHRFARYEKFFAPAGAGVLRYSPHGTAELLECYPPSP